jgi:hypothetical protein
MSLMNNKKGYSLQGWTEGAVFIILTVLCIGIVVVNMNVIYDKNYDSTFGISNASFQAFQDYQSTLEQGMQGEATTNAFTGINLGTTWGMIKQGLIIGFDFVTGGWIENVIALLNLGVAGGYLGLALRLLFVISLGYILLRLIVKVNP